MSERKKRIVVAVSGASGSSLAIELLRALAHDERVGAVDFVMTANALRVAAGEMDPPVTTPQAFVDACRLEPSALQKISHHPDGDVGASIASGSCLTDGMVIVPCSSGTLGSIAHGISRGLVQRAADLTLKERRRLILVLRETPLSLIHAENIVEVTRAGAIVMPPIPAFYSGQTWEEYLAHFTMRVLDLLGLENPGEGPRWSGIRRN